MSIETMKNIIRVIKVICLINIICCLPLIVRNRKVLYVDRTNRTVIQQNLERNMIEDTKFIKKISFAREFNDNVLYIHYWYGKVDCEVVTYGFDPTDEWIDAWEYAYEERGRGFFVGGTSLLILIIFRKLREK